MTEESAKGSPELHSKLLSAFMQGGSKPDGSFDPAAGWNAVVAQNNAMSAQQFASNTQFFADVGHTVLGTVFDEARLATNVVAAQANVTLAGMSTPATEQAVESGYQQVESARQAVRSVIDSAAQETGVSQPNADLIAFSKNMQQWGSNTVSGIANPEFPAQLGQALIATPGKFADFVARAESATPGTSAWFYGMATDPQGTMAKTMGLADSLATAGETMATDPAKTVAQAMQLDQLTSGKAAEFFASSIVTGPLG